jgi:hypothetical protein
MFQKSIYSASWVVSSQCCSWFMWNVAGKALGEIWGHLISPLREEKGYYDTTPWEGSKSYTCE